MKVLITAFEPFNKAKTNSSLMVINELARREKLQKDVSREFRFHAPLPVSFSRSWPSLFEVVNQDPALDTLLLMGQAEGRKKVSYERLALNWVDTTTPDNDGLIPKLGVITSDGPDTLWSQSPIGKENPSLRTNLIEPSYSAGTYVCNHLLYKALEWGIDKPTKIGFIHIPLLVEQEDFESKEFPERVPLNEVLTSIEQLLLSLAD